MSRLSNCFNNFMDSPDVLEMDDLEQPLIPEPIHTTPPNDDYVAPATKSMLDELLEEFGDEILNLTMVDEEDNFNPTKDLEELERLLAMRPLWKFKCIQEIISPESYKEASRTVLVECYSDDEEVACDDGFCSRDVARRNVGFERGLE
ncbi:hypothetical protein Tco_0960464 [Tanacetum coccineum]